MYHKALRLSWLNGCTSDPSRTESEAEQDSETGDVDAEMHLNPGSVSQLLTEDCANVMMFVCQCHYMWAIPLKLAVLIYLLHQSLGLGSVVASVVFLALMVPLQYLLGRKISRTNKKTMNEVCSVCVSVTWFSLIGFMGVQPAGRPDGSTIRYSL